VLKPETEIQFLQGVGPKIAPKLQKLGIFSVKNLLNHYPRRYEDYSYPTPIKNLRIKETSTVKGIISEIFAERTSRKKMHITSIMVEDDTGEISALWFNQPYLAKTFQIGQTIIFRGKVEYNFNTGKKYFSSPNIESELAIFPIYPETAGLSSRYIRKLEKNASPAIELLKDDLSDVVREKEKLLAIEQTLNYIHFPKNFDQINEAKRRLAFSELFGIIIKYLYLRKSLKNNPAPKIEVDEEFLKKFVASLPYKLTDSQRKSGWEIIQDISGSSPMNRMLEGDVGSGKTIVAALAAASAIHKGYQVCWMAPTSILAMQHYQNLEQILSKFNFKIGLLTGHKKINFQDADLVIGTHALISGKHQFPRLGLIIVDEQHRFGVDQRQKLKEMSDIVPHFLSLTATPIPRSLTLSLYGDLDISHLSEVPKGRQKIDTRILKKNDAKEAYNLIAQEIQKGHQAYLICPLIEKTKDDQDNLFFELDEKKTVKKEFERIKSDVFPNLRIGMLHGKMKSNDKDTIMQDFNDHKIDILVSTAVVEVGIDVKNATVMMIEGAENFGLAQLHQLRGRVGRGEDKSYCLLMPQKFDAENNARLEALLEASDGFELAEKDLELRGPGEFLGVKQSGLSSLKIASLSDKIMISSVRKRAEEIMETLDQYPDLQKELAEYVIGKHLE